MKEVCIRKEKVRLGKEFQVYGPNGGEPRNEWEKDKKLEMQFVSFDE